MQELCSKCKDANLTEFITKNNGKFVLQDFTDASNIKSTEIVLADNRITTFNLLSILNPEKVKGGPNFKITRLGSEDLERKFVEYCFTGGVAGNNRVVSVDKIQNQIVQSRFLTELKIIQ
jgi:hypothetical protein